MGQYAASVEPRFWAKVKKSDDPNACWIWEGATVRGYGYFTLVAGAGGKVVRAHRLAYELINGPIPEGMVVKHSCNCPSCVNVAHLSVGTQRENLQDAADQGRTRIKWLDANTVTRIRDLTSRGAKPAAIAAYLNVSRAVVYKIRYGERHKEVQPATYATQNKSAELSREKLVGTS